MKQLRITTSRPGFMGAVGEPIVSPENVGEIIDLAEKKCNVAYIHGEAESLAGYDIPIFIDGDLNQLNLPVEEQDILLLLPDGEHKCKSTIQKGGFRNHYFITLYEDNKFT